MKRNFILFFSALLACSGFALNASAHATPTSYSPEASSVLGEFPREVVIKFTERVESGASGIIIYSPSGSEIGEKALVDPSDAHILRAVLPVGGAEGTYAVSWQVVSADDGHFTKGAFTFSVGRETQIAGAVGPQTQFSIVHLSAVSEGSMLWLELLGQALLVGIFALFLFMRSEMRQISPGRLNFAVILGTLFVIAGALLYFFVNSSSLAEAQNISFDESLSRFADTVAGSFSLYRAGLAVILLIVFLLSRKNILAKEKSAGEIFCLVLILAMVAMRSRVSHAAASDFYPMFGVGINFIHLLFKEMWIGGLMALAIFMPSFASGGVGQVRKIFAGFSKLVSVVIGVAGVTGAYIIWLHLKDPKFIMTTDWGGRFVALTVAAGVLLALRLFHQFIVEGRQKGLSLFRYTFPLETLSGIAVLFFTSLLIITTPPVEQTVFEKSSSSQGAVISVLDHSQQHFQIDVKNENGSPAGVSNLVVSIFNEDKNIGPVVLPAEKVSEGQYFIDQKAFSPSGKWRMEIAAQRPGNYDANAVFTVDYPKDLVSVAKESQRHFGSFEILSIVGAIFLAAFAFYLWKKSDYPELNGESQITLPSVVDWLIAAVIAGIVFGGIMFV